MASNAERYQLVTIAGPVQDRTLPPSLNTTLHPADLTAVESPDALGLDLSKDGRIAKSVTSPTGTTRVQKSATIGGATYYLHYRRLWRINTTTLNVGAPNYDDVWFEQGPNMPFNEDSNNILAVVPFGESSMFVAKSTGGYIVSNCADPRGTAFFGRSPLIQEMQCGAANQITELDGNVYVSNARGLFMLRPQGDVVEVTRACRNDVVPFASKALTSDYEKKRIICGTTGVYEASTGKLFEYDGSTFRFTTRQFQLPGLNVSSPARILFIIEHGDTTNGTLTYKWKAEDDAYSANITVRLPYTAEKYTVVSEDFPSSISAYRVQLQLTGLSANKYIRAITFDHEDFELDDFVR